MWNTLAIYSVSPFVRHYDSDLIIIFITNYYLSNSNLKTKTDARAPMRHIHYYIKQKENTKNSARKSKKNAKKLKFKLIKPRT